MKLILQYCKKNIDISYIMRVKKDYYSYSYAKKNIKIITFNI